MTSAPSSGQTTDSAGSDSVPDANASTGVQDIVVTAEKRSTTVQKTPLAIVAVSPQQLQEQHIVELRDLNSVLPNVQLFPAQNALQIAIRGIGSSFLDPRGDSGVAISIDGLYYTRPVPNGGSFFDIDRVEVLKGPQGTLYGRGAVGGALNIITNHPVDRWEGMASIDVGNLGEHNFEGMINAPVSDTLALRATGRITRRDGYLGGYYDDNHTDAFRGQAEWKPTDRLTILASANYAHFSGHGNDAASWPCPGVSPYSLTIPVSCSVTHQVSSIAKTGTSRYTLQSYQLNVDYNLGFATLTSIGGYVGNSDHDRNVPTADRFVGQIDQNSQSWSEELRLASAQNGHAAGSLGWTVGGYYASSEGYVSQQKQGPAVVNPRLPQRTGAVFGQATYGIIDWLRATAGIRYTQDVKRTTDNSGADIRAKDNNVSWKVGLEADVAPRSLLYATVSTGYVAGGANGGNPDLPSSPANAPSTFKPEKITDYEIGSKNRFLNGQLEVNVAAYYYDFRKYQYFVPAILNTAATPTGVIENIGNVKTYGGELDVVYQLTPKDQFSLSGSLAHGTFGAITLQTYAGPPFSAVLVKQPSGLPLINLPKEQMILGYEHRFPLASGGELLAAVHSHISGGYWVVPGTTNPNDRQRSYTMTDLSLSYSTPGRNFNIIGWVKNVENSPVVVYGLAPGIQLYSILPPRTYGATLTARF